MKENDPGKNKILRKHLAVTLEGAEGPAIGAAPNPKIFNASDPTKPDAWRLSQLC